MVGGCDGSDEGGAQSFSVELVLVPGFSMMALSAVIEPLRAVNRTTGEARYAWRVAARAAGPVAASNGLTLSAIGLSPSERADLTIVIASLGVEEVREPQLLRHLRRRRRGAMSIGAVSNGSLILARAGLLAKRRATIHWEMRERLAAESRTTEVTDGLFCIDREVMTAAGGAAGMDMMLALIAQRDGRELALEAADQFLHWPLRGGGEAQRHDVRWRYNINNPHLVGAIRIMEARQTAPLKIGRIAELVGVSERQLERCFEAALKMSPSDVYRDIRMKSARRRLLHSTETLEQIADRTGFSSPAHFSRAFKSWAGASPSALRRRLGDVVKMQEVVDPM